MSDPARRAFVHRETIVLGRFLDAPLVVGWSRSYRCDCGFTCRSPGEIWDHTQGCRATEGPAQGSLFE